MDGGRLRLELRGHRDELTAVAWSADGTRIATGGRDGTARVWDAADGASLRAYKGHDAWVRGVAFVLDGRLVSAGVDGTVRLWPDGPGDGVAATTFRVVSPPVHALAAVPAVAGGGGTRVLIFDGFGAVTAQGATYEEPWVPTREAWGRDIAVRPDGRQFATAEEDGTVRLWPLPPAHGQVPVVLRGHEQYVRAVAYSPDGRTVASGAQDAAVRVWDAATGESRQSLPNVTNRPVTALAFAPDGGLVSGSDNGRVVRIDPARPDAAPLWTAVVGGEINRLAFSPDGRRLAVTANGPGVLLLDAASGRPLRRLDGHGGGVASAAYSPDGRRLATASADGTVRVWDANTGVGLLVLRADPPAAFTGVAWTADGDALVAGTVTGVVVRWQATTPAP